MSIKKYHNSFHEGEVLMLFNDLSDLYQRYFSEGDFWALKHVLDEELPKIKTVTEIIVSENIRLTKEEANERAQTTQE